MQFLHSEGSGIQWIEMHPNTHRVHIAPNAPASNIAAESSHYPSVPDEPS